MEDAPLAYPQPTRTAANAPLLDGWRQGELMLQRCDACAADVFFPRERCPVCWSMRLSWRRGVGTGRIVSFTVVHRHIHPAFAAEAPTVFAEIALDDGGAMLARVITLAPQALASGMQVELVPLPDAARYPLPTFRPAG